MEEASFALRPCFILHGWPLGYTTRFAQRLFLLENSFVRLDEQKELYITAKNMK